jgi:hypothetical protein
VGTEVFGNPGGGRFHGILTLVPVGGAHFPMLFGELQGVENTQGFVDVSSQRQVIDHLMANNAFAVYQEQAAQGDSGIEENLVGFGNRLIKIGHQGKRDLSYPAILYRHIFPRIVGVRGVYRHTDNLAVVLGKFAVGSIKGEDLRGADEGKIEGVEKEQNVFPPKRGEGEVIFKGIVGHDGSGGKVRSWLGNE